jgi:preprotein translocase subunit SecG
MEILLTIIYVLVCLFLILVVLLQSGKAGDLASAFGGASSQTAFGARGTANLLSKATTICAVLFLVCALALAVLSAKKSPSILQDVEETVEQPAESPTEGAAGLTIGEEGDEGTVPEAIPEGEPTEGEGSEPEATEEEAEPAPVTD